MFRFVWTMIVGLIVAGCGSDEEPNRPPVILSEVYRIYAQLSGRGIILLHGRW